MNPTLERAASETDSGARLDVFVAQVAEVSRSQVAQWLEAGLVRVNGRTAQKPSLRVQTGDVLEVDVPEARALELVAQEMPLEVVHEDADLIVINKPSGLVVHPAPGHDDSTLVNALLFHCKDLSGIGGELRPGIVHRIDKDTSGLLVVTKNDRTHACLSEQFAAHTIDRTYQAICVQVTGSGLQPRGTFTTGHHRHPTDRKRFTGQAGGKRAVTHYEIRQSFADRVHWVELRLETGRTHQIRMHLSEAGSPILHDPIYGAPAINRTTLIDRLALHAATLGFTHPDGQRLHFSSELPPDMKSALEKLSRGVTWRT